MKRIRVIWQYILFYFIISAVPILAILFYFYPMARLVVINKAKESNVNVTRNITNTMNAQISSIYSIAREIKTDSKLTPYALTRDRYAEIEAVEELKKIVASSAVVYDVLYYMEENNTLYTKNTLIRVDTYDSRYTVYKYQNREMGQFLKEMSALTDFEVLPAEPVAVSNAGIRDMITFVFPITGKTEGSSRTVALILVEESDLTRLVDIYSGKYEDNVLIFDYDNNLVTCSNKSTEFSEAEMEELLRWDGEEDSRTIETSDGNFILSKVKSKTNGWSYISYINRMELTGELDALRDQTILIVAVVLFLEFLLIGFFAQMNYRPVKRLLMVLQKVVSGESKIPGVSGNEFQKMEYLFGNLYQLKDELNDKIKQAYPAIRNDLLKRLINGQLISCDVQAVNRMGEEVGVCFSYGTYCVAVASFEEGSRPVDLRTVNEFLNRPAEGIRLKIYAVSDMRKNLAVLLTNQEKEDEMIAYLSKTRETLMENFGIQAWIGISNSASDIRDYSFLYVQALSAIEFLQLQKETGIIRVNDLKLGSYALKDYPVDLIGQLEMAVAREEEGQIRRLTGELAKFFSDLSLPVYYIRILYRNVISCLVKGLLTCKDEADETEQVEWNRYLFDISYSPEALVDNIQNCCSSLCIRIGRIEEKKDDPFQEILDYIGKNCLTYDFSIHSAAETFGIKVSNFSQYFKKKSGITFKQYVDCIKVEKAKALLSDTEESLEQISEMLCYSNASSFIRAFKRICDMTPGEYREKVKREKET